MSRDHKKVWDLWWAWVPAFLALIIFAVLFAAPVPASADKTSASKKLLREIDIMERTLDDVLVDSPYILVSSHEVTKGVYVPEYGVIFTFDMNLVASRHDEWRWFGSNIDIDEHDDRIVIRRHGRWDDDDDDADKGKNKKDKKSWWERREADSKKCYERGKTEIIDAVLDYGDMMTALSDDHWVLIAAALDRNEYFSDLGLSQYIVKARMGDLRAHTAGTLSRDAVIARLVIEES
ncbi:MAG: hypothetical protein ACKVU1_15805 [bacterium]